VQQGRRRAVEAFQKGPGTIYIHYLYGWACIDLVAADGSVLVRAVDLLKANGPGKVSTALALTEELHLQNVADSSSPLWLEAAANACEVSRAPRIGISQSIDLPLRFFLTR
jgi:3-methyladenine DNA glycosylase Mpg